MISTIWTAITEVITGFLGALSQAFSGVQTLFITQSEGAYEMTFLGYMLLLAVGCGVVYFVFRLIKGLIQRRG